ncbi:MAG: 5-guanidino-2-oxopentanoate decarboxylase [Halocynthiibacter sp.]
MTKRPLGAQISHMLKARGVDMVFGIPGVHNLGLYRGIEDAGIRHVLARHEQGAGFMADGYARATGRPGVAYVISGPGLTNIMTPMGQAYSDSVPMLVISSCLERADPGTGRGRLHQMPDQEGAAATVCDWSHTATDATGAYKLVDRALAEFQAARARPKHIQVPVDVLAATAPPAPEPPPAPAKPRARAEDIATVAKWLDGARRPLFLFGGGASGAAEAARRVVEITRAATLCTYAGRGIIHSSYRLNYGACLARPESAAEIARADLVVAVGTELSEVDLWRNRLGHDAPLVRVDIDPQCLADDHTADLSILGDAGPFLNDLVDLVDGCAAGSVWSASEVAAARALFNADTDADRPGIAPVCKALRAALPDGTQIYSDMTQFAYVAKEVWDMNDPAHWHHPYGFGTLGYGLPAAIGGKLGLGRAPVLAIVGDYGFHYTMQELGVAVEHGLSLPIILWDNSKLKEIEDGMISAQIAPNAVVARNPDFCALAAAFGAGFAAPTSLHELQTAVRAAFAAEGPTLIRVTPDILNG